MPNWLLPAVGLLFTAVHAVTQWHNAKPTDAERAALLNDLADGAAAFVISAWPKKPWADLVAEVIKRLAQAKSVPTKSTLALENAANAALIRLGVAPPDGK